MERVRLASGAARSRRDGGPDALDVRNPGCRAGGAAHHQEVGVTAFLCLGKALGPTMFHVDNKRDA